MRVLKILASTTAGVLWYGWLAASPLTTFMLPAAFESSLAAGTVLSLALFSTLVGCVAWDRVKAAL